MVGFWNKFVSELVFGASSCWIVFFWNRANSGRIGCYWINSCWID